MAARKGRGREHEQEWKRRKGEIKIAPLRTQRHTCFRDPLPPKILTPSRSSSALQIHQRMTLLMRSESSESNLSQGLHPSIGDHAFHTWAFCRGHTAEPNHDARSSNRREGILGVSKLPFSFPTNPVLNFLRQGQSPRFGSQQPGKMIMNLDKGRAITEEWEIWAALPVSLKHLENGMGKKTTGTSVVSHP